MNQKGFTLIEMIIVLFIISILLLITIPNVASQNAVIKSRGCEALIKMVQAQLQAHELDADNLNTDGTYTAPTLEQLKTEGYIETTSCPGGKTLIINPTTGKVEES